MYIMSSNVLLASNGPLFHFRSSLPLSPYRPRGCILELAGCDPGAQLLSGGTGVDGVEGPLQLLGESLVE
ncbi:MAG: hypothetical protein RLZZ304_272 [Actinomycetota bacterium]